MEKKQSWPIHVRIAIGIAALALASNLVGNYFQWLELQPKPQAINTSASATPANGQQSAEVTVSGWPFLLSSLSSLSLFVLLVLLARQHSRTILYHAGLVSEHDKTFKDHDSKIIALGQADQEADQRLQEARQHSIERLEAQMNFIEGHSKELSRLETSLRTLDHHVIGAEQGLQDHLRRIAKIENVDLPGMRNHITALSEIPFLALCISWLVLLQHEAAHLEDQWSALRIAYPVSNAALHPFSVFWGSWPGTRDPKEVLDALGAWMGTFQRHMKRCNEIQAAFSLNIFNEQTAALYDCAVASNCKDLTGQQCVISLEMHVGRLRSVLADYATASASPAPKATIS